MPIGMEVPVAEVIAEEEDDIWRAFFLNRRNGFSHYWMNQNLD
jgi:hypothetical protein